MRRKLVLFSGYQPIYALLALRSLKEGHFNLSNNRKYDIRSQFTR